MSVMDELRALEQRVQKRLRELAPRVAEYRDLEKVAERLGIKREPWPEATEQGGAWRESRGEGARGAGGKAQAEAVALGRAEASADRDARRQTRPRRGAL